MIDLEFEKLRNDTILHLLKMTSGETIIGNFLYFDEETKELVYEYLFEVEDEGDEFYFINYLSKSDSDLYYLNPQHVIVRTTPSEYYSEFFLDYLIKRELEKQ